MGPTILITAASQLHQGPHPCTDIVLQLVQVGLDVVGLVLGVTRTGGGILGGLLQLVKRRTQ